MLNDVVDFFLDQEKRMLKKLFSDLGDREVLRIREEADRNSHFPIEVLSALKKTDMFRLFLSKEFGGIEYTDIEKLLFFYELAKRCAGISTALSLIALFAELIEKFAPVPIKQKILKPFAEGNLTGVVGLNTLTESNGNFYLPLFATVQYFILPVDAQFVLFEKEDNFPAEKVNLTGLRALEVFKIPEEKLKMKELCTFKCEINSHIIYFSSIFLGLSSGAISDTLSYIKERSAFGKKVYEFESIRRNLFNLISFLNAVKTFLFSDLPIRDSFSRQVFNTSARITEEVVQETLRMYGGYGYIREYPAEKRMRDAKTLESLTPFGIKRESSIF